MEIDCPNCGYTHEDIGDSLPDRACDDAEYQCENCWHTFTIGWTAEAEVRNDRLNT